MFRAPAVIGGFMSDIRVLSASPEDELRARVRTNVTSGGHRAALELPGAMDALDACMQGQVDVAILDQFLSPISGSEIAAMLRDLGSPVSVVVLHRGELSGEEAFTALNPTREGSTTSSPMCWT